jgi:hypothetical protein
VAQARDVRLWEEALSGQIFLGGEAFIQRMQAYASLSDDVDIPRVRRRPVAQPLQWYLEHYDRDTAIVEAFVTGGYTQSAIARATSLSVSRISRVIKASEAKGKT